MPDLPPDTPTAPPPVSVWRGRLALALGCAVLAVVGIGATGWWWSGTEGSLAWAVSQAARWLPMLTMPDMQHVTGSVRHGGSVGELRWSQPASTGTPLTVQATGVVFRWQPLALWGGQLKLDEVTAQSVRVTLPHSDEPTTPLQSLTLPIGVDVAFAAQQLTIDGPSPLHVKGLSGHYAYDQTALQPARHRLKVDRLGIAAGDYALEATLQAEAPMALQATLLGQVQTTQKSALPDGAMWVVQAQAQVQGTLSGDSAVLKVDAQLRPQVKSEKLSNGPELDLAATVRPWALQQLPQVQAKFVRLNLAELWPQAPVTSLNGAVVATPEGAAGLTGHADVTLDNASPGPLDRQRLPLAQLKAQLRVRDGLWTLSNGVAQLGGGALRGEGRWQAAPQTGQSAWAGELTLEHVNLAALHTAMAPVQVDGSLSATDKASTTKVPATAFDLSLKPSAGRMAAPSQLQGLALREVVVQGDVQADQWLLHTVRVDAAQAQLTAQGEVNTRQRGFKGQVNGRVPGGTVSFDGQVQMPATSAWPQGAGELRAKLTQADLAWAWLKGLPMLPGLDARTRAWDVKGQAELAVQWPPNATGAAGAFQLSVPQAQLQAPQEGAAPRPDPVRLSQWQVTANGPWSALAVKARGAVEQAFMHARVDTQAAVSLTEGPVLGQRVRATVERFQWQLEDMARRLAVRIESSPTLPLVGLWEDGAFDVRAGSLTVTPQDLPEYPAPKGESVTLGWTQLRWDSQGLRTQGTLSPFSLVWVDWLAGPGSQPLADLGLGGQLRFEGDWDVHWPRDASVPVRLNAGLQRRSGDLRLSVDDGSGGGVQNVPAGLQEASLRVVAQSQPGKAGVRLQSQVRWVSDKAGTVNAQASTDLQAASGVWTWPTDAAVQGALQARLPQIGAWSLLAPPGWRMQGTLAAQATLSGTRSAPLWHGELQADQLALRSVVNGIEFLNGQLRATLAGDKVVIERFALEGAGGVKAGGQLQATGSAQWVPEGGNGVVRRRIPRIEMQVTAERLRVSSRADQRLVVSGQAQAQLLGAQLQLRGKLKADQASITLPDELTPSLGDDVVVRGRQGATPSVPAAQVVPDVLLDLDLGNNFAVQGHGLKARLEGALQVRSTREQPVPRVQGEVRSTSGTYRAYGVNLTVETGVLRFAGPYDNPSLDILAIRPNITQRVGVQVTGTAQAPNVRLYAEPELPDAEKLSWVVLGRSASGPGGEAAILQQAALSLLGKPGNALQGGLASTLGLDDVSYRSGGVNADGTVSAAAVSVGKRLSSRLYLVYGQSLTSSVGTVSILYELSRRLTLRAKAGEENTLEVIFTQRYD